MPWQRLLPVVIDRRGASEIVEHGVSGYLWKMVEHLKEYTSQLDQMNRYATNVGGSSRTGPAIPGEFSEEFWVF